ncbi:type II toxin-antitoxin system prevent-host-death family antitoxin [Dendronalium sp. ChiSLP03b]|uniref:type II toxin-antitoxin system Phd/YefM family antitoxin n=1 Tax=Dendronalium sp. ChiSLP03b TaxID=3075381 RepID=UPI002AD3585E|nr:type II toxin-antitoxin system prevent-host-death family antitoxin [Dendronalium sp. ChiSLP03b]MDZ8206289.1 type II toxin-antitoxin system prevent-host-death family antitoxin [Dendronalium sp. ChiSLP03b]
MSNQTNLTDARKNLAELCTQVVEDREVVIITRQEGESVALIAIDELDSLLETSHLLRSPKNAARLLTALERAKARTLKSQSINELRQELGIDEEEEKR